MAQVVTISASGEVSGLQVKPGKGLNLTSLGKAAVVRASEIVWDDEVQRWKIDVLQEVGQGVVTTQTFGRAFGGDYVKAGEVIEALGVEYKTGEDWKDPITFGSYDDAVKVEIAYLDAYRLRGEF